MYAENVVASKKWAFLTENLHALIIILIYMLIEKAAKNLFLQQIAF